MDTARALAPIRAVLFDKDGTLVDFNRTWGPAVQTVLRQLARGDDVLFRRLSAVNGLLDDGRFTPDSPLIDEPTSTFAKRCAGLLGGLPDAPFICKIDRQLCQATTAHLSLIGDPLAVFAELTARGYRLGLLTNDAEATARAHARKMGLDRMLAFIAGYDSGFGAKPAPEPVLAFAAAVGVSAAEVAMIGDTMLDVATARSAGARMLLVLTGPRSSQLLQGAEADAVIASISDLPAWLDRNSRHQPMSEKS